MSLNESKDIINFWEFLGLPMNSPLAYIKKAYYKKFKEIEKSLDAKETTYTASDLITANDAYATLSDPYKRFLHNCEISGENPVDICDYDPDGEDERDLPDDQNETFLNWLKSKAQEYLDYAKHRGGGGTVVWENVDIVIIKEIAEGLVENYIKTEEIITKKQTQDKKRTNRL